MGRTCCLSGVSIQPGVSGAILSTSWETLPNEDADTEKKQEWEIVWPQGERSRARDVESEAACSFLWFLAVLSAVDFMTFPLVLLYTPFSVEILH